MGEHETYRDTFNYHLEHSSQHKLSTEQIATGLRELYNWQYNNTGSFSNMLFTMFQKADPGNQRRLAYAFPEYWAAYNTWCQCPESDVFFQLADQWLDYWKLPNPIKRLFAAPGDPEE